MSDSKVSLHRDHPSGHLSALARNHGDTVHNGSANRMNCYKAPNFYSGQNNVIVSSGELGENEIISHGKATTRVLLNPLARNKSIKINHFDMVREPQKLKPEEVDGQLCDTNGKTGKKVSKKNSFSRIFATISAGSKFPRVFLGRNSGKSSQRAKLNLEDLSENAESSTSLSTLSSSPIFSPPSTVEQKNATNRKHGSATSSDSDSFVIPRPRLIVPVHTYARKRRTGNLNSDQSISTTNGNCDRSSKGKNSKKRFLSLRFEVDR